MCRKITEEFKLGWVERYYDPDLGLVDDSDDGNHQ